VTPGVYLALSVAVLFGIGTLIFAAVTAPRHQTEAERRARRQHPSWPHNTPPHTRHRRR
jgi:hypothetical protein